VLVISRIQWLISAEKFDIIMSSKSIFVLYFDWGVAVRQ
jgi:hypothetical protein